MKTIGQEDIDSSYHGNNCYLAFKNGSRWEGYPAEDSDHLEAIAIYIRQQAKDRKRKKHRGRIKTTLSFEGISSDAQALLTSAIKNLNYGYKVDLEGVLAQPPTST